MGANQSSNAGGSNGSRNGGSGCAAESQRCYYEVLGVYRQAPEDEIKKAYHKKALELHPDRNYGNVEDTTRQFATVQSAYEILSDPQERAWYDAHREAILDNQDASTQEHYDHNVRITTADDILRMFTRFHGRIDYSDSATGFYSVLRTSFETLGMEERLACGWENVEPINYPSFGHANDSYEGVVKPFYAMWNSFATKKTFSWADIYRYSDAPDRRVRRLMEKENKRAREEAIREFNDAVRSLLAFVKKRDPRFKPKVQTEAERQKILKDAAIAQAARSRASNQAKHVPPETVPEWMKSSDIQEDRISDDEESTVNEQYECVVCKKSFKSERQYEAHEKSKKHIKAVQHLRRQMQQEDKNLNLDEADAQSTAQSRANSTNEGDIVSENEAVDNIITAQDEHDNEAHDKAIGLKCPEDPEAESRDTHDKALETNPSESISSSENDEHAFREEVENRILGRSKEIDDIRTSPATINDISEELAPESPQVGSEPHPQPKLGKAKEKRARKAAQKAAINPGSALEFRCAACQAGFPSKTRLFNHIKDFGHAQPLTKPAKGGKIKK